ncbi:hypothetical protein TruAng_006440 [Truncatella angustata]|nr:hypothetical protein TruAng_006440 [Truncatella angustata]
MIAVASRQLSLVSSIGDVDPAAYYSNALGILIQKLGGPVEDLDENILAALVLLRTYEELTGRLGSMSVRDAMTFEQQPDDDTGTHLSGVTLLLNSVSNFMGKGGLGEAASWIVLRQDMFFSMTNAFTDNSAESFANRIVFLCARIQAHVFGPDSRATAHQWTELKTDVDNWFQAKPWNFRPMWMDKAEAGHAFPCAWMHHPAYVVAYQNYCLARMLLAIFDPWLWEPGFDSFHKRRYANDFVLENLRLIVGLSISNPSVVPGRFLASHTLQASTYGDAATLLFIAPDPYQHIWYERPQADDAKGSTSRMTRNIAERLGEMNREVVIFWGSQSGTAEGFANRLARELHQRFRLEVLSADLSYFDPETIAQIAKDKTTQFILSTYGEGDPSDNASDVIDQTLRETRAEQLLPMGTADDAHGTTEEDFVAWRDQLLVFLGKHLWLEARSLEYDPVFKVVEDESFKPQDLNMGKFVESRHDLGKSAAGNSPIRPLKVKRFLLVLGLPARRHVPISILSLDKGRKVQVPSPTTIETLFTHYLEISARVKNHSPQSCRFCPDRLYSISSSSIVAPRAPSITVGVSSTEMTPGISIPSLASNYLHKLSQLSAASEASTHPAGLTYSLSKPGDTLKNSHLFAHIIRSKFKLPAQGSCPIIMVSAGTGIAPFRGFISERSRLHAMGRPVGDMVLFHGCRHPVEDNIYEPELEGLRTSLQGRLRIIRAFSRPVGSKKVYVQDRVQEESDEVRRLLADDASVCVCGWVSMAREVERTVTEMWRKEKDIDNSATKGWSNRMKRNRKWQEDVNSLLLEWYYYADFAIYSGARDIPQ